MQIRQLAISARAGVATLLLACALPGALVNATAAPAESPPLSPATSAEARAVFAHAKDKLLQVRVIHKGTRARAATGTGFVATAEGLVLTNYHVVSKLALEPEDYALELECTDGSTETPRLVAIDVANDLAVLATGRTGRGFLPIRPEPLSQGERGFSMGHPLDLGLTIVEGNYNGYIETEFARRIHYTGAINSGMSGGPAVTADGEVFGVNVARRIFDQLVSYLVPSDHAAALLRRAAAQRGEPADFRKEVAAQLLAQQERLYERLQSVPMGTITMGRYTVPDLKAPFVRCWGFPNSSETRLVDEDTRYCSSNSELFVESRLSTGEIQFMHERFEARELGAVRFAARIESAYAYNLLANLISSNKKELSAFRCHDGFVSRPAGTLRVALCSRAYKHFAGLYDFVLRAATVDSSTSALVSTLTLRGVSFETGRRFAQQYLEALSWTN
ncbi:MAG: serine protease [Burkholderiales bacterium]|nr:serine protease [Burkholderiales bacterium]